MPGTANATPLALDLMLDSLVKSIQFTNLETKNWDSLCRLVPGTTAKQCQVRYEELLRENASSKQTLSSATASGLLASNSAHRPNSDNRPGSNKSKSSRDSKDSTHKESNQTSGENSEIFGGRKANSLMVIHVSDEAKKVEQDFHCPRDLLVSEMRYFAEYLSSDAQRAEEVDISVHCDVDIFDWLMRYVKRKNKKPKDPTDLGFELSNFTSILISSHFLKMDALVTDCIHYCYQHINELIASHTNMNCIKDKLVGRIADEFNHNEADNIRDRKDKFKSKIFSKKLEKLFDISQKNDDSPESAATLYRCVSCKKVLTVNLESKLSCIQSRLSINRSGHLQYTHTPDPLFDVNSFVLELKSQLQSWREVYWRIWGMVNYLQCSRCHQTFQCTDLGHCRFHPDPLEFDSDSTNNMIGKYPCCETEAMRFDPTEPNNGCKVRDHIVNTEELSDVSACERGSITKVYNDLLAHREAICVEYVENPKTERVESLNIFLQDELASAMHDSSTTNRKIRSAMSNDDKNDKDSYQPRLQALTIEREVSLDDFGDGESEDENDCDEDVRSRKPRVPRRSRVTVDPQAILLDGPDFNTIKQRKWDSTRSMRWNQDAQREEDLRRMFDMANYLTKLRITPDRGGEKARQKEMLGGVFCRLDAQWRAANIPLPKAASSQFRAKPTRLTTLTNKMA